LSGEKEVVVWPQYFDSDLPRRLGRRVPLSMAVSSPTPEEVEEALSRLGLEYESVEARYPRVWWVKSKKIIVRVEGGARKTELLKRIAEQLKKVREERLSRRKRR
jgi:signal recognition particle subunit SRP19